MKSLLKRFVAALAAVIAIGAIAPVAAQGAYPTKPVRLVVPFPAGGTTDILARAVAQKLSETWGQQVIVDNRPGAGGNIGSELVAKAPPDGYTLLMGTVGTHAINPSLYAKMPYDHVGTLVHASRALNVYTVSPTLFLSNDHTGHTELCSLFLDQRYRLGKNGPLLAKSRLMFMAEFAQLFAPKVIAELRGRLEPDGSSPFWEGLGRHFFAMEYSTADYLTGLGQKAFIAELMPRHPVYVNLLPPSARDAIGAVHADTAPARAMLEQEGFRYEGYVDIFDAGPTVECARENIDLVRRSARIRRSSILVITPILVSF